MKRFAVFAVSVLLAWTAHAHDTEALVYDQIDLTASAERQVDNDLLIASVFAEAEAQQQSVVADRVNQAVQWAVDKAKTVPTVKAQTTQYNTSPVYNNNTIKGWRARQSLQLESKDPKAFSDLIGQLQEKLGVESIGYSVSKESRDAAEQGLIDQALAQFQQRATLIARNLGRSGFRLVRINVGSGGGYAPPIAYRAEMRMAKADVAAPALAAGVQTVNVTVSGTIQLEPKQ